MTQRTRVVQNTLTIPGSNKPWANRPVSVRLNTPGFGDSGSLEILSQTYLTTDATGMWSLALPPNADLDPEGTWYSVREDRGVIWSFQVPWGTTPINLHDCLIDNPPNPTPIQAGVSDAELAAAVLVETERAEAAEGLSLAKASDLSDLGSPTTARANLGLSSSPVSVAKYGATGDGTTDDSAAVNAAYADTAVKDVIFERGKTYLLPSGLSITKNTDLNGAILNVTGNVTFNVPGSVDVAANVLRNGTIHATNSVSVSSRSGFTLDGLHVVNGSAAIGIYATGCSQFVIRNCTVTGGTRGIVADQSDDFSIEDNHVHGVSLSGAYGILVTGADGSVHSRGRVLRNRVADCYFGICIHGGEADSTQPAYTGQYTLSDMLVAHNEVTNSTPDTLVGCIWSTCTTGLLVSNNIVDGGNDVGVDFEHCAHSAATDNQVNNIAAGGLSAIFGSTDILFASNTVSYQRSGTGTGSTTGNTWKNTGASMALLRDNPQRITFRANTFDVSNGTLGKLTLGTSSQQVVFADNKLHNCYMAGNNTTAGAVADMVIRDNDFSFDINVNNPVIYHERVLRIFIDTNTITMPAGEVLENEIKKHICIYDAAGTGHSDFVHITGNTLDDQVAEGIALCTTGNQAVHAWILNNKTDRISLFYASGATYPNVVAEHNYTLASAARVAITAHDNTAVFPVVSTNPLPFGAVAALGSAAVITSTAAPIARQKNRYSAAAGALAITLPALSGLAADGAEYYVEKDSSDTTVNSVTFTCAGSDTFETGGTTKILTAPSEWAVLIVVTISGTKRWAIKGQGLSRTQQDNRFPHKVTVDDLPTSGLLSAHRGSGVDAPVTPEESMSAYKLAAANPNVTMLDSDLQTTADGVLVLMHDATVDRTTGGTGNVSSFPYTQLPQIDCGYMVGSGFGTEPVLTLDEFLREFGGKKVIVTEPKQSSDIPATCALVLKYNLGRSVLIGSGSAADTATIVANGCLPWQYGITTVAGVQAADAAGAWLVEIPFAASTAIVTACQAAVNIKRFIASNNLVPLERKIETAAITAGIQGYVTNALGYLDGTPYYRQDITREVAAKRVSPGWWTSFYSKTIPVFDTDGTIALSDSTNSIWRRLSTVCGPKPGTYSITFTFRIDSFAADTGSRIQLKACVNNDEGTGSDASLSTGYLFGLRANGQMLLSIYTGYNTSTSLGTKSTTALVAGTSYALRLDVTPTTIQLVRVDTGDILGPFTNSTWRGNYIWVGGCSGGSSVHPVHLSALSWA